MDTNCIKDKEAFSTPKQREREKEGEKEGERHMIKETQTHKHNT